MTVGHNLLDHLIELLTPRHKRPPASQQNGAGQGTDHDGESQHAEPVIPWVLCIDDDADYCNALKLLLESHGVAVVRAYDGVGGVQSAFVNSASAILLDYHLPDAQGDYVLGRLKDADITRHIPVIVVTGVVDRALNRKMLNLGAEIVLTKPVEFNTLRSELAKHIDILADAAPGFEIPKHQAIV